MARQDYVDDLAQRFEHKVNPVVAEHACDAALPVAEWFDKRGLKVSSKTMVVASSNKTLAVTMVKLRARGLKLEKGRSLRDLGVDNAGGRKGRKTATQKQKVAKLARRARRLKKLTEWTTTHRG